MQWQIDTGVAIDAYAPRDRTSICGDRLFDQRRVRRELLVLRRRRKAIVFLRVTDDPADQLESHRRQGALPQLARGFALLDEAPLLRGDRARVHPFRQVVNRSAGNGIAFLDRPFDRGDAAMTWQQRRVIANAAEPRVRESFAADARVTVCGDDEIGP